MFCLALLVAAAGAAAQAAPLPEGVPELLKCEDGTCVTSAAQWERSRRPEIQRFFEREVYGVRPVGRPEGLGFEAIGQDKVMMNDKAVRKRIRASWKGPRGEWSFDFTAFIPKKAVDAGRPAPSFVLICNRSPAENIDPERKVKSGFWPAEEIVDRGYAAIAFFNGDLAPDDMSPVFSNGVYTVYGERGKDTWGALSAWAWGASRVMDWIETEPALDAAHVAVVGHSRGGKTALLAGATDARFAMACVNDSGCSGAKLNHIDLPRSESIARITKVFRHWFALEYEKWAGREREMPYDQHELIAMMAPRLVAVGSATDDNWAGQLGEFHAARLASPAWELYGKSGLLAPENPPTAGDRPADGLLYQDGCVSYHIRPGAHALSAYDWHRYMDFADRHGWRGAAPADAQPAAAGGDDIVFENARMRLVVGCDARVKSLVARKSGEEMVAPGAPVALMSAELDRPIHNEIKLIHPNKRVVYAANALKLEGDLLTVSFEREPFKAEFKVRSAADYLAFEFVRFTFDRNGDYGRLKMDAPPVARLRAMQLKLAEREHFGDWLNAVWDARAAAAVVAASPYPEIDHEDAEGARVLFGALRKDVKMRREPVALVVGCGKEDFLDAMDALERDFGLPRGVKSRRGRDINASILAVRSLGPENVDQVIDLARRGGFRLAKIYYTSLVRESGSWGRCGDYDWNDSWPGREGQLRDVLARLRAAGVLPGLHFLQTHIGMYSRYVTPVADVRLHKKMRFTLAQPLPEGTDDVPELRVHERTCEVPEFEPCRVLQFGGELLSYESASSEPPYRFFGVKRGAWHTRPQGHEPGQVGGILDMSEFGSPASCYIDQNNDLQDEVADKIANLYNCGFEFVYMDGSEGVPPPGGVNVPLAQYRVWKKLSPEPSFGEGAAKAHFSWHMITGANAFDSFPPEEFKKRLVEFPVAQAPHVAHDMSRCNFGWWSMICPGECIWWNGQDETIGTQPDMWDFGCALSVSWGCPTTCSGLDDWRSHPRGADLLEVMRRWEDVRARGLLTPAQTAKFKALGPDCDVTLLVDGKGGYQFRDVSRIAVGADSEGRRFRAFAFGDGGKTVVQFWCADKPSRAFFLPPDAPAFEWRDEYAGKTIEPERSAEGTRIVAAGRQYLFFDAPEAEVRRAFARAVQEDLSKGVDVAAVRADVASRTAVYKKAYGELDAVYSDASRSPREREDARVRMLGLIVGERKNLMRMRDYAKGDELAAVVGRLAKLLATEKKLCGF